MSTDRENSADQVEERGEIQIKDVKHVLKLLIEDLYGGDPHLTIRELIQNAHDAIVELPDKSALDRKIVIRLNIYEGDSFIEILDSGIGMTKNDVINSLCIVGDSDKLLRARQNPQIIGRFGIGFLSSFIIANRVEVVTRKLDTDQTWLWKTENIVQWTLSSLSQHEFRCGTRVRLYFKDNYASNKSRVLDLQTIHGLTEAIRRFAYLLPIPIYVQLSSDRVGQVVNLREAPWESDIEAEEAYKNLFSQDRPVFIHRFSVSEQEKHAAGVLYFRDELLFTPPSLKLYVKRLLVDDQDQNLLPVYAPMVTGFVECPDLNVDLARRQISRFDPVYAWLQDTIHREYQEAFIKFAKEKREKFVHVWTRVDNTFIARLLHAYTQDEDTSTEQRAIDFAVAAARYFPFHVVDTTSGGLGRPLWRMIDELIPMYPGQNTELGKVIIHYTESKNPIEKDMLIEKYGELLDVSLESNSHAGLMTLLHRQNDKFGDFVLERVTVSQFKKLDNQEFLKWQDFVAIVRDGVKFQTRDHEVTVEIFNPIDTPIVITDDNVDEDVVKQFQTVMTNIGGTGPEAATVAKRLKSVLDGMGGRGGLITVHINASNPLMILLRDAISAPATSEVGRFSIINIMWRTVLDYYGWSATRDMIARERQFTKEIVTLLVTTTRELSSVRESERVLQNKLDELKQLLPQEDEATEGILIEAMVGFIEIVDATRKITSPTAAPEQAIRLIQLLIREMQEYIESFSTPVSFTGNGLQFYIQEPANQSRRTDDIQAALMSLPKIIERLCATNGQLNQLLRDTLGTPPKVRVALSFGKIFLGSIGPSQNILGLPVEEAVRLCNHNELFQKHARNLLITEKAYEMGSSEWKLWKATDFVKVDDFEAEGLPASIPIYGPRPE